jgi:hypothetical protein
LPEVKLRDFNIFFCAEYTSEIRFAISAKLSEKQAHLEYKAFAVGRLIGEDRRPEKKAYSSLSVMTISRHSGGKNIISYPKSFVSSVGLVPL